MSDPIHGSMTAPERYRRWIATDVAAALRPHGYARTRHIFHLRRPEGWGVITFQASQFGDRLETAFTIEIGGTLDRLWQREGVDPMERPPVHRAHWRQRLSVRDDRVDRWWRIDHETDLDRLNAEILPLLERSIPLIGWRMTSEGFAEAVKESPASGPGPDPRAAPRSGAGASPSVTRRHAAPQPGWPWVCLGPYAGP